MAEDAAASEPSVAAPHDALVHFGKHKGKTFGEAAADPGYVEWARSVSQPTGPLAAFVKYLHEHHTSEGGLLGSAEASGASERTEAAHDAPTAMALSTDASIDDEE